MVMFGFVKKTSQPELSGRFRLKNVCQKVRSEIRSDKA